MTYHLIPCPKCQKLHGVVAVRAARTSRSRLDDSARLGNAARDRVEPETPEPSRELAAHPARAMTGVSPSAGAPAPVRASRPRSSLPGVAGG